MYLFYILTTVSSSSSTPSPFPASPLPLSPSTLLLFLFRKGQAPHGYWQSMAYHLGVRLGTLPCIKAMQPVWGIVSEKPAKKSGIRSPTRKQSYTAVTYICRLVFNWTIERWHMCMAGVWRGKWVEYWPHHLSQWYSTPCVCFWKGFERLFQRGSLSDSPHIGCLHYYSWQ